MSMTKFEIAFFIDIPIDKVPLIWKSMQKNKDDTRSFQHGSGGELKLKVFLTFEKIKFTTVVGSQESSFLAL